MRYLVTYSSKYGSTERYARWISEALGCDLLEAKHADLNILKEYGVIIHGGGLYAGGLRGVNRIAKHLHSLPGKHIVFFTCGLADPNDPENVAHIREGLKKAWKPDVYQRVKLFHLRGGIDYEKLNPIHKAMMAMLVKTMKRKGYETLRSEDRLMLDTYGKQVDFSDRDTIQPLVVYVTSL